MGAGSPRESAAALGRTLARHPWLAYLGLTALAHPVLETLLFGERALQTAHDVFDDDVPRLFSIAADWREFGPSLWDTHLTAGNALFAQFALPPLAPDVLLSFLVPPFAAYSLNAALMTFLAGLAMHLFLRDSLRLPVVACFAGGIVSTFAFWHYIYGYAVLLLPLALLWTERAVSKGAPRRHVVLAALLVAFLALSSQVQIIALAAGLVLAWVLVTADGPRDAAGRGVRFFVPWVAGALLIAPILLTQVVAVGESQRTLWTLDTVVDVLGRWGRQLAAIPFGIEVGNVGGTAPLYGSWFPGVVGLPLLFASLAIPRHGRREWAAFWLLLGLLLADLIAAVAIPLQNLSEGFIGSFQFVRVRHLVPPLVVINVVLMIAWLGRPGAIAGVGRRRGIMLVGLAAAAIPFLVLQARVIARPILRWLRDGAPLVDLDPRLLGWQLAAISFAVGAVTVVAVLALVLRRRRDLLSRGAMSVAVVACLLGGLGLERAVFTRGALHIAEHLASWGEAVPPTSAHEFIAAQPGGGRVLSVIEHANRALSARLDAVDGYETIYPVRYHALFGAMIRPQTDAASNVATYFGEWGNRAYAFSPGVRKPIADLLGVRWLYVGPTSAIDPALRSFYAVRLPVDPAFESRFGANGIVVYENPAAFPRAFIVHAGTTHPDRDAALAAIEAATSSELRTRAFLVDGEAPGISLPAPLQPGAAEPDPIDAGDAADLVVDTPDRVEIGTRSARPGLLVLADTFTSGWVAELDGRRVPIVPVDVALRGVALPAGDHVVTFSYRPIETYAGFALSLLTLLALVAWLALPRLLRRPPGWTGPRTL